MILTWPATTKAHFAIPGWMAPRSLIHIGRSPTADSQLYMKSGLALLAIADLGRTVTGLRIGSPLTDDLVAGRALPDAD
jgi:hypothetical protein